MNLKKHYRIYKSIMINFYDLRKKTIEIYNSFKTPTMLRMIILGAIIGFVGGLGAVVFHYLILGIKNIFFGATSTDTFLDAVTNFSWYYRLFAPAIGGLIVGPMVTYVVNEARGHGVPEVMEAVALRSGAIRFRVAPMKTLISAICIGSGGSAGREGPIVQIGASFGSSVGQFLKLSPKKVKTLLGAGAAAGVAGTFNAPLAGVVFSMEVLLRDIELDSFSPIVIASVIGTAVANIFFGRAGPIFNIPTHEIISYWELLSYIGLGIVGAAVAIIYGNSLYKVEDFFEKINIPEALKAALGGLLLGMLALAVPQIHSTGYPVMEAALHNQLSLGIVFIFMASKILATILTLGSGGSGGIFAPSLFIGSMMGSTYGNIISSIFPAVTASATSYAMIGMGTVFAGATHAPLTAIVILFEMTRDPMIILPLMFACVISSVVTSRFQKRNIYTAKLLRRGIDIDTVRERELLEEIQVKDVMSTEMVIISKNATISEAREIFKSTFHTYLPVVDEHNGNPIGLLRYNSVFEQSDGKYDDNLKVKKVVHPLPAAIYEHDTLLKALKSISQTHSKVLPVLADDGTERLVGILSRSDIIEAYNNEISDRDVEDAAAYDPSVSVEKLINTAFQPIKDIAMEKGVEISINIEDQLPKISVESNKISWVLTNILGNAVRYTPQGEKIVLTAWESKGRIFISVKDSGPGINPDKIEEIFKKDTPGYGLAISKEIIESFDGNLWAESKPGEGAKFSLYLPSLLRESAEKDIQEVT